MHSPSHAPMYLQFDLRKTTREEVVEKIRVLETAYDLTTTRHSAQMLCVWAEPKSIDLVRTPQFSTNTLRGLQQFGKKLGNLVETLNSFPTKQDQNMSITGAPLLGEQFRSLLGEVKKQLAQAAEEMNGAMGELKDTTVQAAGMVKQVKAETADLKAALGLNSNNPPT